MKINYDVSSVKYVLYDVMDDTKARLKFLKKNIGKKALPEIESIRAHRDRLTTEFDEYFTTPISKLDKVFFNVYSSHFYRMRLEKDHSIVKEQHAKMLAVVTSICKYLKLENSFTKAEIPSTALFGELKYWSNIAAIINELAPLVETGKYDPLDLPSVEEIEKIEDEEKRKSVTMVVKNHYELRATKVFMMLKNLFFAWSGTVLEERDKKIFFTPAPYSKLIDSVKVEMLA